MYVHVGGKVKRMYIRWGDGVGGVIVRTVGRSPDCITIRRSA